MLLVPLCSGAISPNANANALELERFLQAAPARGPSTAQAAQAASHAASYTSKLLLHPTLYLVDLDSTDTRRRCCAACAYPG